MKVVVTGEEMKELDAYTISHIGLPSCVLMERAALKTVEEMKHRLREKERILVVCGSGNNGGDGMAVARLLHLKGIRAEIFFVGSQERMTDETKRQWKIAAQSKVPIVNNPAWDEYTTIVDAVFGVGLSRPIQGKYEQIIREMNYSSAYKIAVDIPSGVDADTGLELGIAFCADLTVTFAYRKRGLCFYPGRMYAGEIVVADIGIYGSDTVPPTVWHLDGSDMALIPERLPYGNKGTFGKVLLVAGSEGMCGAAFLGAEAALKAGAGMVKIQTVEENRIPLQILLPEAMVSCVFEEEENKRMLDWCDILVIGPGLGTSGKSRERAQWFLSHAWEKKKPVVLDADGLNLLAVNPQWKEYLGEQVILTPHLGEMSRLCGKSIGEIQRSLVETASSYAKETGAACVLKDACTVISDNSGKNYLNISGNCGMATAGSGDVLAGLLAGVLCMYLNGKGDLPDQGVRAALGVYLHGVCGDLAAEKIGKHGMTARDIVRSIPEILKKI